MTFLEFLLGLSFLICATYVVCFVVGAVMIALVAIVITVSVSIAAPKYKEKSKNKENDSIADY